MTTAYTSLLGLALPVTGELSGTWGDTVNTAITSLLDTAVAGTTSITTDADITLTTTTGASNQARQAIILWNPASGTVTRNITAPAQSKMYTVINASGGTQSIVIRGVGPTTGVTILKGESALVAWDGSDFVKVSSIGGAGTFTNLTVTGNTILGDAIGDTLTVNATTSFTAPVNLPSTGRSAAAALTPTNPAFLYGVASTYTDTTSSGTLAPVATFYSFARPTLATSNVTTYTNAATLYIANSPAAGGSATITNPYAVYVAAGANYFGGNVTLATLTSGRVPYASTAGLLVDSANMLFDGTNLTLANDAFIKTLTIGQGTGAISTNTALGYRSIYTGTVTGTENVGVGYLALRDVTSGQFNSVVGAYAAYKTTSGSNLVAVGDGALADNTSGSDHVAIGYQALKSNTTASFNIAIGYQALYSFNRTADTNGANVAIGYQAGYTTTTGNYNVFVGNRAGQLNQTGTLNAAMGYQALYNNVGGSYSTAVGYQAAYSHANTGPITAIGYQAGYNYNSANGSTTFVGYQAGYAGGTGRNTGVGTSALAATTAQYNTAVGVAAGLTNISGEYNTYMGYDAGRLHLGSFTTLIGALAGQALNSATTANTAVGYAALYTSQTGDYNTAIARSAMYSHTGSYNTAMGYQALTNGSGSYNVAIGGSAFQNSGAGNYNVVIGINAGQAGTANSSTMVGYQSAFSVNGTGPVTAIGYEAGYGYTGAGSGGTTYVGWRAGYGGGYELNTALGTAALYSMNNTTTAGNTALGYSAGYFVTGNYNTFVGYKSGETITSGYENTILGRYDGNSYGVDIRTSNNWIVLSDGTGRPQMSFQPSGSGIWRIGYTGQPAASQPFMYFMDSTGYDPASGRNGLILSNGFSGAQVKAYTTGGAWDVLSVFYAGNAVSKIALDAGQNGYFQTTSAGQSTGTVFNVNGVAFKPQAGAGPSANANTLDAYEEGSWTPVVNLTSTSPTVTYSLQIGSYTRIGNQVTIFWDVQTSSITGGSGQPSLTGLPFTVGSGMGGYSTILQRDANIFAAGSANNQIKGFAERSANYLVPQLDNSGTSGFGTAGPPTYNSGGGRWTGWITYQCVS